MLTPPSDGSELDAWRWLGSALRTASANMIAKLLGELAILRCLHADSDGKGLNIRYANGAQDSGGSASGHHYP
jgi:hypothetical protein